jgi:hypothetical protein
MNRYFNFHAALVLFTSLSQKAFASRFNLTGAQLQARRQIEHNGLTACMNTLAYCATEDPLAKQYLSFAEVFQSALSAADVELQPETHPEGFPTALDTESVNLSPSTYDYSASVWPTLPALINTSASQTSMSTSLSYQDSDDVHVQVQTNAFDRMQHWFIDPTCGNYDTSSPFDPSISNSTWSVGSYEPDAMVPRNLYAPPFARYAPADDCVTQPITRH